MNPITVLLADDHQVVREEFKKLLELEDDLKVVGEAINGLQALDLAQNLQPAVVLMDVKMPGMLNGLQAARQVLKVAPATKVLMLSAYNDEVYVEEAINSGASGFLVKQTSAGDVCQAIREVQKGNTFFSSSIARHLRKRTLEK